MPQWLLLGECDVCEGKLGWLLPPPGCPPPFPPGPLFPPGPATAAPTDTPATTTLRMNFFMISLPFFVSVGLCCPAYLLERELGKCVTESRRIVKMDPSW